MGMAECRAAGIGQGKAEGDRVGTWEWATMAGRTAAGVSVSHKRPDWGAWQRGAASETRSRRFANARIHATQRFHGDSVGI